MNRQFQEKISPERLMECVDAISYAWESHGEEGIPLRHPLDIHGAPDMPACLSDFTRDEVREASRFLERLGIIVRIQRP